MNFCLEHDLRFNMVLGGLRDHDDFLASLANVDRNPLSCTLDELRTTSVMRTIFNGAIVWDSGAL